MKHKFISMLETLSFYHRDKDKLMQNYIEERLTKSFSLYDKELQQSLQILTTKHEKSILKRMAKLDAKSNR